MATGAGGVASSRWHGGLPLRYGVCVNGAPLCSAVIGTRRAARRKAAVARGAPWRGGRRRQTAPSVRQRSEWFRPKRAPAGHPRWSLRCLRASSGGGVPQFTCGWPRPGTSRSRRDAVPRGHAGRRAGGRLRIHKSAIGVKNEPAKQLFGEPSPVPATVTSAATTTRSTPARDPSGGPSPPAAPSPAANASACTHPRSCPAAARTHQEPRVRTLVSRFRSTINSSTLLPDPGGRVTCPSSPPGHRTAFRPNRFLSDGLEAVAASGDWAGAGDATGGVSKAFNAASGDHVQPCPAT